MFLIIILNELFHFLICFCFYNGFCYFMWAFSSLFIFRKTESAFKFQIAFDLQRQFTKLKLLLISKPSMNKSRNCSRQRPRRSRRRECFLNTFKNEIAIKYTTQSKCHLQRSETISTNK